MVAKKKTAVPRRKFKSQIVRRHPRSADDKSYMISIEYSGGLWQAFDRFLSQVAKDAGGKNVGSGYGFHDGFRDLQFVFPSTRERGEFLVAVRAVASVFVTSMRDE